MLPTGRAIRHTVQHRLTPADHAPTSQLENFRLRQLHQQVRYTRRACPAPSRNRNRNSSAKHSAIDPVYFFLAAAISTGIAYIATSYTSSHTTPVPYSSERTPGKVQDGSAESAHEEHSEAEHEEYNLVMASNMPPGRPGNLTPDQTEKLKDMWAATLDVFGVAHDTNGAARLSSENTSETASTTTAQKKKKRLSLFKRKDKDTTNSDTSNPDNDKHGQTKEFQQALASQTPEELRQAFWSMAKHDHPDALLLRFLRARKWDVHAALIMMVSTMHWRSAEMHVDDDIMLHGDAQAYSDSRSSSNTAQKKEGEDFLAQLRLGKSFLHGTDKDGRPCCYVRVRLHKQGEQSEKSLERFTVYQIETTRMLLRPPVDTATIVFDMTDFSMANMDYTPVKFMIKCFEANYPESLGSVLVYKSPWIFQGIWKIIKGWLDPVVASKVHFASNVDELQQWIPKSRIMKELGGDEDYTYHYIEPREGENSAMNDTAARDTLIAERKELVSSYETETLAWVHGEDAGEGRMRLAQRLAENYWKVDPFVRARSLYDRMGMLGTGGKLDFYPRAAAVGGGAAHDDGVD